MKPLVAILLALSLASTAAAGGAQPAQPSATGARPLPQEQTENGVKYRCGGIGMIEAARLKQIAPDYDLMLTFATGSGAYLTDIDIEISRRGAGVLLRTRCNGPIMLVDMPQAGAYRISATTENRTVTRKAQVKQGQRGKRLSLNWPEELANKDSAPARR